MPDPSRRTTSAPWGAIGAGVAVLALLVAFTVGLSRVGDPSDDGPVLPATLAGGWIRLEDAASPPADPAADPQAADFDRQQRIALAYVNRVLGRVYTEPTQFETYVAPGGRALVLATLFDAAGGAFAPDGLVDPRRYGWDHGPVELSRHGDAVCVASYQTPADTGPGEASSLPLSVSCQAPVDVSGGEATAQLGSTAMSVRDTVALLDDLVSRVDG